ncbi:DnaJ family domain-containing protein [Metabacillus iocasae]|uniref:Amino acid-binding ACT domain protein n=1 Tax=Priestia iocasae TaxID=2291674 RepID=A0ABS2QSN1_9BACI|nr:DnaJ family domain-containing protein [Metabacillus iocasae]MBM7702475.1 putative amino acid-binding ACT domain protein [Metabacillus iocasae]
MDISHIIAEERIKKAQAEGEFDHLPGSGKPLQLDDLAHIPPELRQAYRMMKNANMVSEESVLKQGLMTIEQLIERCHDEDERHKLKKELTEKQLKLNQVVEKKGMTHSAAYRDYQRQIQRKFL